MLHDLVAAHPFFSGLPSDAVDAIAAMSEEVRYPSGWWMAREGQAASVLYAVVHGRAVVEAALPGHSPAVLATVHAGEIIGWSWLFPPHRWHFDVMAVDDLTAIAVRADDLRVMLDEEPRVGNLLTHRLARGMAERLAAARIQLLDVYRDRHG